MTSKLDYFVNSLWKKATGFKSHCPYCGSAANNAQIIDRKYIVTALVSCKKCALLYRLPSDDVSSSKDFYQEEYSQGYTTDMPDHEELNNLMQSNFLNSERDYSRYCAIFEALGLRSDAKILDYGCSWGYGVYQLSKAGYVAEGFEISKPRANFGREQMNLSITTDVDQLSGEYDVFFSSHVLEHVADLGAIFSNAQKLLKKDGFFIAVTPNGSEKFRKTNHHSFHRLWGQVHPVLTNDLFVVKNFQDQPYFMTGLPFDLAKLRLWKGVNQTVLDVNTWELMFIIQNKTIA